MTTHNTGNPVPSAAVKDLYDNAENLDSGINGDAPTWTDRKGRIRKSMAGIETDFQQFLVDGSVITFTTYADAVAANVALNRQVQVIGDLGTHNDPISGAPVSNSGTFLRVAGGLQWVRADTIAEVGAMQPNLTRSIAVVNAVALPITLGAALPFPASNLAAANSNVFTLANSVDQAVVVKAIMINVGGAGVGRFHLIKLNTDGSYEVVDHLDHTFTVAGVHVIDVDSIPLPRGGTIAYQRISGDSSLRYSPGTGVSFYTASALSSAGQSVGALGSANLCLGALVERVSLSAEMVDRAVPPGIESSGYAGLAIPFPAPTTNGGNNSTYVLAKAAEAPIKVRRILVQVAAAGVGNFDFVRKEADGTWSVLGSFSYAFPAAGFHEIGPGSGFEGFQLPVGGSIGYRQVDAPAIMYRNGTGVDFLTHSANGGVLAKSGNVLTVLSTRDLCLAYAGGDPQIAETAVPATIARRTDLPVPAKVRNPRVWLERNTFEALPADWLNNGGFTFSAAGAASGATGLSSQLRLNKRYGLEKRTMRWKFRITSADSIVALLSFPVEGATSSGGCVTFDATDSTIKRWPRYTGSNNPLGVAPLEVVPLGFTPVPGKSYVVEVTLNGRTATLRAFEAEGAGSVEASRTAVPRGWTVFNTGTNLYDQGMFHGSPGVAAVAGGVVVESFSHSAPYSPTPRLYIAGDSETEGFGLTDAQKFSSLLANEFAPGDVVSSGIGGTTSAPLYQRMKNELANMRPQFILVWIGTNSDGALATNLNLIRSLARNVGAQLLVCTVPRFAAATDAVLGLPNDVTKVRLEYALTAGGVGGGSPLSQFFETTDQAGNVYSDGYHLGPLGGPQFLRRLRLDAPELFYD